jgi:hypothetical protein
MDRAPATYLARRRCCCSLAGEGIAASCGLRAERTSLLSLGDDQCRFAVLETNDPLVGYTDKIEQRFAGQQEPR